MPRISPALDSTTYEAGTAARPSLYDERAFGLVQGMVEEGQPAPETIAELVENPHEALRAEFAYMSQLYRGRSVESVNPDGTHTVQFATRSWNKQNEVHELDDRYSVTTLHSGEELYRIKAVMGTNPQTGYDVVFTDTDILTARVLAGSYAIPLVQDNYPRVSADILKRTLDTARIVNERRNRDPEAAALADENAKDLLELELGL